MEQEQTFRKNDWSHEIEYTRVNNPNYLSLETICWTFCSDICAIFCLHFFQK